MLGARGLCLGQRRSEVRDGFRFVHKNFSFQFSAFQLFPLDAPADTRDFDFDLHVTPVIGNRALAIRAPQRRKLAAVTELRRQPEHPRHVIHAVSIEGFPEGQNFQRVENVVGPLRPALWP